MKRLFMLALLLTIITGSAFANNTDDVVKSKVLYSFTKTFSGAEDVQWETRSDLYRAKFKLHGQVMFAYYNNLGEQVALSRNISIAQLPLNLATELQSEFNHTWLTNLFEVALKGSTAYYATIESATHRIVVKAEGTNGWMLVKRDKK
jgi:hypothetical protein